MQANDHSKLAHPPPEHGLYETCLGGMGNIIGYLCMAPCCFANPYIVIEEGNIGVFLRFGRFDRLVQPGIYYVNPMCETLQPVNIQLRVVDVNSQSVMTKDNVTIGIDSILYYKVSDVYKATFMVQNVQTAVVELTHTTMRDVLGKMTLQECVEHRDLLATRVKEAVSKPTHEWGVDIENMLIKELVLTTELQVTLSAAAKAKRLAESRIISAEAEVQSARLMREASDILATEQAMQMRYLDTLAQIAKSNNAKIVFMPIDQPMRPAVNTYPVSDNAIQEIQDVKPQPMMSRLISTQVIDNL
jgi:erythrocyte band 7 integral membrane protein